MNSKKLFLYLLIVSVAASALIGIIVILFGNFGDLEIKVLLTTMTATVTSILGLACGAYLESGRGRVLPLTGIVLAIIAALMSILVIWFGIDARSDLIIKSSMSITLIAVACSHLSLLSLARLDPRFIWSRYAAHLFIWSLTGLLLLVIWGDGDSIEWVGRTLGVLSILVAAVTIVTPVLHKLSSGDPIDDIDLEINKLRERIAILEAKKAGTTNVN